MSDRPVTQNGIIVMGTAGPLIMLLSGGSVRCLVVLYSINVFITFCLSQLGMVRHWWMVRSQEKRWLARLAVNGLGLAVTTFILISVVVTKFYEGGWITIVITGSLTALAFRIRNHYRRTNHLLERLNDLLKEAASADKGLVSSPLPFDRSAKTAVLLVNGFNGLGLHTLFNIIRFFGKEFRNFVFVQIGVVDAGNFKGTTEIERLQKAVKTDLDKYVTFMRAQGYFAERLSFTGVDVITEAEESAPVILKQFPHAIFFGGQLVFPRETFWNRWLHNYTVFSLQRIFYQKGIPFIILPIRV